MKIIELEKIVLEKMLKIVREHGSMGVEIEAKVLIDSTSPKNDFNVCFESLLQKGYIEQGRAVPLDRIAYKLTAYGIEYVETF